MKILPNTQRLGKLTFDSNQVRKSSTNPNVLIAKASDGKDYGVVRKSDGSYDFAGSTRNLSLKDRLIMGINQESTPGDKLYSAASTLMSEPQRMMTRGLTNNKYNTPGEVVANSKLPDGRLKNTLGLASDMIADPSNLVGIGAGAKAAKFAMMLPAIPALAKSSKIMSKIDDAIQPFKSEINWSKWNKEIPDNIQLMKEYDTIEQTSKANNTWMKNPDGSSFEGTPEQFVQQSSNNFKKAFPEGYDKTYRGDRVHYNIMNDDLYNLKTFTGNKDMALNYTYENAQPFTSNSPLGMNPNRGKDIMSSEGIYELYGKKSINSKILNSKRNADYSDIDIYDEDVLNYFKNKELGNKNLKSSYNKDMRPISTDDLAYQYLKDKNLDNLTINNIYDSSVKPGTVRINNNKPGNYLKSMQGNNGMFDMNNPNIYKGIVPGAIAAGAAASTMSNKDKNNKFKYGGKLLPLLNKF